MPPCHLPPSSSPPLALQSHVSDVLPLYLVSGAVPALVDVLSASQLYDTAFNVAAVQASGGYAALSIAGPAGAAGGAGGAGAAGGVSHSAGDRSHSAGSNSYPSASGVGAALAGDAMPPPSSPPGVGDGSGAGSSAVHAAPVSGGGSLLATITSPTGISAGGTGTSGGGASGGGSTLPPLRPGGLPALARAPSLRPPPLAPIQTSGLGFGGGAGGPLTSPPPTGGGATPPGSAAALTGADSGNASPSATALRNDTSAPLPTLAAPVSPPLGPAPPSGSSGQLPMPPAMAPAPPPGGMRSAPSMRGRSLVAVSGGGGGGGGGAASAAAAAAASREALERATSVRCSQARVYLMQGLPMQAACCALSVDDVGGAVGLLLRGGCEEAALALVMGLTRPLSTMAAAGGGAAAAGSPVSPGAAGVSLAAFGLGVAVATAHGGGTGGAAGTGAGAGGGIEALAMALRPRVMVAAAQRREAAGDYLTAAELVRQLPGAGAGAASGFLRAADIRDLLAGRCRAHSDPLTTNRVFAALGLQEHAVYSAPAATAAAGASAASGSWDGFRALLLGGAAEAAAEWALKAAGKLVDGGRRPSLTSPEWEQAWAAVNSLAPSALGRSMWLEVFGLALYAGAMAALEQGSAAVGLYLVRVLEAWAASTPVSWGIPHVWYEGVLALAVAKASIMGCWQESHGAAWTV